MSEKYHYHKHLTINYEIHGKGQPILFLHGLAGSLNNWKDCYPFFQEKGFQTIGIDLPGFGESSKPMKEISIASNARMIKDFVHHMKFLEPPIIVGNSMGGHIGSYYAAKYKTRLKALVIADGAGLNQPPPVVEFLMNMAFQSLDQDHLGSILQYMNNIFISQIFHNTSCENAKLFVEEQKELAKRDDYKGYCFAMEHSTKEMINQPIEHILTEIKVPVLILWGKNDHLIPSYFADQFHKLIPDSEVLLIDKCGHVPQLEKPDIFNESIYEFIKSKNLDIIVKPPLTFKEKLLMFFKKKKE